MDLLGHHRPMTTPRYIIRVVQVLMLDTWAKGPTTNKGILEVFDIDTIVDKGDLDRFLDTNRDPVLILVVSLGIEKQFAKVFHTLDPFMLGGMLCLGLSARCDCFT